MLCIGGNNPMTLEGLQQLKRHEGFSAKPYVCPAGYWTIGHGHNLEDDGIPKDEYLKFIWTPETAHNVLVQEVIEAEKYLKQIFPRFQYYSPRRQDALTNLMYQVGVGTFKTFTTVIKGVTIEDWEYVAKRLEAYKWYKQSGKRSPEIVSMIREG